MEYFCEVTVALKESVFDPQGERVRKSLNEIGFNGVLKVRMGKSIEILLWAATEEEARKKVEEMAEKILINPILETYTYKIEEKEAEGL